MGRRAARGPGALTTGEASPTPPPGHVRRAFGATAHPERLTGGTGQSWRCGGLVLKPDGAPDGTSWLADLLADLPEDGFRLARPVRAADGRWAVDGWTASRWVVGESGPVGHWPEVLAAARAFHRAVAGLPRPPALDARDDRWARADRAAWGEAAPSVAPALVGVVARLRTLAVPVDLPSQLVHGDLSGNVLVAAGARSLAPAVIDVSPYWRPAAYAEAVAVADGLLRWGEDDGLLDVAGRAGDPALVARGLLFRLLDLDEHLRVEGHPVDATARTPFERAVAALERRTGARER